MTKHGASTGGPPADTASTAGTGTAVPASAEMTRCSRTMSCAVAATVPTGGRRSTTEPAGLSTR
jgi:hypothetical protein